jgi:uncharacterized protein (DUF433 family)
MYLGLSRSTLRSWVKGRFYNTSKGKKFFEPVIVPAHDDASDPTLSFYNLIEAYVLSSLRLGHDVKLHRIRKAIDWLQSEYPFPRPLLNHEFFTDGLNVFVKKLLGRRLQTINASSSGQLAIEEIVNPYLSRIERDESGEMFKIFPSIPSVAAPKLISMVYNISSGRPIVDSSGVRASAIWNRSKAGETISDLADDYGIQEKEVMAAIEYGDSIRAA